MKKINPDKAIYRGLLVLLKGVMDRIISEQLLIICGGGD
jgi:hypothetical protein